MTETRRSTVTPVPPPRGPFYDANNLAVHKALCRACQSEHRVPVRIDPATFVCARCAP